MNIQPGHTGTYTATNGYQKAAIVVATHESVEPDTAMVQPQPGHVHIAIFGIMDLMHPWVVRPDVPLREVAESIPDYTMDGKLVGFFEPAPAVSVDLTINNLDK